MTLLILGVLLWSGAHFFKRLMPAQRAAIGEAGEGVVAVASLAAVVLMVLGYRWAPFVNVWTPPAFMVHINNALMVLALWTFGSSMAKGAKVWPATRIRHPQLAGVMIWAVAHLLVNGDLASILLFGGLLAWAAGEVIVINRAAPAWSAPAPAGTATWVRLVVITLVLFAIIAFIHLWLGVSPFPS